MRPARTPALQQLLRSLHTALFCNQRGVAASDALQSAEKPGRSRRDFLKGTAGLGLAGAALQLPELRGAAPVSVGIVGGGLAGLACGFELKAAGIVSTVYEGNTRLGGRCSSLRNFFPGQVAERGGEFIDTLGTTMLGYAKQFKLPLEDVNKEPGEIAYYFFGQKYTNAQIVDELRAFTPVMHDDLQTLSNQPTAAAHTPADVALDKVSLASYLASRKAGALLTAAIRNAYVGEYGLELDQQSCLNFLLYIRADRRSMFQPFGVSDQRYHITSGNDGVVTGLADGIAGQIQMGRKLVRASKTAAGRIRLEFASGFVADHDIAVFAIPFTTLRDVQLDASLGLPASKSYAIQNLSYGTNSKMMVGFQRRIWQASGGNGAAYADLSEIQNTWETNPANASSTRAVLTNFTGGHLGLTVNSLPLQKRTQAFLNQLDQIFPGAASAATVQNQNYLVDLEYWPANPWSKGSYTCYSPGQFTSIGGNEGTPVGNLFFAGEHTDSFYDWQGFLEGAAVSGKNAAVAIRKFAGKL